MSPENEKIAAALELLNEAARDQREDIREMINERYALVRELLEGDNSSMKNKYAQARLRAGELAATVKQNSGERIKEVNQKVHESPWAFIGGVAVSAILLGYLFGHKGNTD
jgi:ElaB/YqjD/DUF883 family membrane-anchored ribosome-binding protein